MGTSDYNKIALKLSPMPKRKEAERFLQIIRQQAHFLKSSKKICSILILFVILRMTKLI